MSNLASDYHDYTERDPRCTCRQVHGNADDDGICSFCYARGVRVCSRCEDAATVNEDGECAACADREPGDSHYEDHGQNRHELQDAWGGWRR